VREKERVKTDSARKRVKNRLNERGRGGEKRDLEIVTSITLYETTT
jgi:hypothetical protein